ncbi:MAG: energy-coupling factor transporter ATPase [Acetobacteraceae bacterium]|nr:energy-coupling factor transporter ATPase [Acetobacteraceae bacterium]
MVRAENVSFRYGAGQPDEVAALFDVDLRVAPGEYVAVIGPNGSGKSTLAKHINALLMPSSGRVVVAGIDTRDPDRVWEVRQAAGMVFQNPDNQIVATVVEEDVAFGPENLGMPPAEIRRRVKEALEAVRLLEYSQHAPYALSGGQKQRLAIAGVLAIRPRCLVLDEPTAMLDPVGREEVLRTVRRLNREDGIAVIHITQDMEEAAEADRVVVMDGGRVVLEGTPRQVFARADLLRELGLEVPQVTELAQMLRADGLDIPPDLLTVDELVAALCPS